MNIKRLLKGLNYLLINPRYFYLYYNSNVDTILQRVNPEAKPFSEYMAELDANTAYNTELQEKSLSIGKRTFKLRPEHYFLYAVVRALKPAKMMETGVFNGFFTSCYLAALHKNHLEGGPKGLLVSIDLPPVSAISESTDRMSKTRLPEGHGSGWVIPDFLREYWELHLGDSKELLPALVKKNTDLTLFFHDSLHTYEHMMFEYEVVWPYLKNGSLLMSHDVHWNKAFPHIATKYSQRDTMYKGVGLIKKVS